MWLQHLVGYCRYIYLYSAYMHVLISFLVLDLIKSIITNTIFELNAFFFFTYINVKSSYPSWVLAI